MLTSVQKPSDVLRLLLGVILLGFAVTTFLVFTYILLMPLIGFFIPAIVESLPAILDASTDWTGLTVMSPFGNSEELFFTLVVRSVMLGTLGLAFIFLVKSPVQLIRRGVAGDFATSKIIPLGWYGRFFVGFLLLGNLTAILEGRLDSVGIRTDIVASLTTALGITMWFLLPHLFSMYFLVGFWNVGCELVEPFLQKADDS